MSRSTLERVLVLGAVLAVAVAGTTPAAAAAPRAPEVCTADPGYDHCVRYTPAAGVGSTFRVPEGVSSVHAMAWGAGGGRALQNEIVDPPRQWGGGGGYAEGDIPVSPGEQLAVGAGSGGQPGDRSSVPAGGVGFRGASGGSGGGADTTNVYDFVRGAGGGGASGVARADGRELLLAGGGGGGSYTALWDGGGAGGDTTPGYGRGAAGAGGIGGAGGQALAGEPVAYSIPGEPGGLRRGGSGGGGTLVERGGGGGGGGYGGGGGGVSWQMVLGAHSGSGGGGGNGLGTDVDGVTQAGSGDKPGQAGHRLRTPEAGLGASGARQVGGPGLVVLQWAAVDELTVLSGDDQSVQPGEAFDALWVAARIGSGAAAGASVTFTVTDDGGTGTAFDGSDRLVVVTGADGVARTDRALVAGADTGEVRVRAEAGEASVDFILAVGPRRAGSVVVLSGAGQTAERGAAFAAPLGVRVESARGWGVPDVPVTFTIQGATGSTFAPSDEPGVRVAADGSSVTVTTVDDLETPGRTGTATAPAIVAGESPGSFTVVVDATGVTGLTLIELAVVAGTVTGLQIAGGDEQSTAPYTAFEHNLRVQARNSSGAPVQGVPVTFAIQGPTGSTFADGTTSAVSTTDSDGLAGSLRVLAGDSGQVTVVATVAGGPLVTFYLTVTGSTHLGLDPLTHQPR